MIGVLLFQASISNLRLHDLPSLQMVSAFTLESLGEMRLFNLPKLAKVTLPVLQQVQQVKLEGITLSDTYANLLVLCNTLYATAVHFSASFIWASAGEPSIDHLWFGFLFNLSPYNCCIFLSLPPISPSLLPSTRLSVPGKS